MNLKILILTVAISAAAAIAAIGISAVQMTADTLPVEYSGFTYYDIEGIQSALAEQGIRVTVPTAITDRTLGQYCMIPDGNYRQPISYCTTTAVLDSDGGPLGNINMGGNTDSPAMALAILETGSLDYKESGVLAVFEAMIDTLVCDCWEQILPGDIESADAWLGSAVSHYSGSESRALKSNIDGLGGKLLILEINPKDGSFLWVLYIIKQS